MARRVRENGRSGYIHIIERGVNHQDIFYHDSDYERFLEMLGELKKEMGFDVVCYCLMSNHLHLLIHDKERRFAEIMRKVGSRYALYFNRKYERTGHLFQSRYLSKPIDTKAYLLTCIAYIHNNPEKARICSREKYRWSSFSDYITGYTEYDGKPTFCNTDFVRRLAGSCEAFSAMHDHQNSYTTLKEQCFEYSMDLPDGEVRDYLCETLGCEDPTSIQAFRPAARNKILDDLKELRISCRQISRITGISLYLVRHTTNSTTSEDTTKEESSIRDRANR